jgi:antitoxin component YwqK of YwqJK toxin-antitoxin module
MNIDCISIVLCNLDINKYEKVVKILHDREQMQIAKYWKIHTKYTIEENKYGSKYWYRNGKIHVEIDTSKNHMGGFDEERTSYYKTGNIKEKSTYINNHEQGECEFYYNNGRIKKRYNIINRKKDGPEETYYANGNRKLIVRYTNGKKEGVALFWDHNGQETQIDYHNDQRRK